MSEFLFATGIECSYPTIRKGTWRMDEMEITGHYKYWRRDLECVKELGIKYLRYGPPLHLIYLGHDLFNWEFTDKVFHAMDEMGIIPIIDLCHFGLPFWLENFQNPDLPNALQHYAEEFVKRYPQYIFYTPINEMYVTARHSALEGIWNEELRDEKSFVTAVKHLARANAQMTDAIAALKPEAIFINSESSEFYQPCCPDERIVNIAHFENERRFLPMDLYLSHEMEKDMLQYLFDNGLSQQEHEWFMARRRNERTILGIDYYEWNEKLIDSKGRKTDLGELFGWYVVTKQYYDRYQLPIMHTETNTFDAEEAPAWLWRQWHNVHLIRKEGIPVVGFTWYSLTDQIDWDSGLSRSAGNINPCGLFDLNRDARPVAQAYKYLISLFRKEASMITLPLIEEVLHGVS